MRALTADLVTALALLAATGLTACVTGEQAGEAPDAAVAARSNATPTGPITCKVTEEGTTACGYNTDGGWIPISDAGGGNVPANGACPEDGCPSGFPTGTGHAGPNGGTNPSGTSGNGGTAGGRFGTGTGGSTTPAGQGVIDQFPTSGSVGSSSSGGPCPEDGCPGEQGGAIGGGGGGIPGTHNVDGGAGNGNTGSGNGGFGTGTGGGTGIGGNGNDGGLQCSQQAFQPGTTSSADIMLVIDRSGSMGLNASGYPGTKWEALRDAVTTVVNELNTEIGFGLAYFPAGGSQALQCSPIPTTTYLAIADNNAVSVSNIVRNTLSPAGGTPTAPVLGMVNNYLVANPSPTGRKRAVVLATDGAPNCNASLTLPCARCTEPDGNCPEAGNCLDDSNTLAAVRALATNGFATFVVGIPGIASFTDVLAQMAQAGGTGQYYDASSSQALEEAFRNIGQRLTNCRFELDDDPAANTVTVRVNGSDAPRDASHQDGWDYVGARTIEFFGPACDALVGASIQVAIDYCVIPEG